ncbi:hypothetical protein FOMPIDRAFT_1045139 [Fomitopsis schrenkii]|uniref:Uncharacterized protein n=1 Tax=Fomitopsis schrenkii TaxID=2126942 RepID=S8G6P2_FOMSC|nr:hypothetical protein FOMPIDRAFT_1045139 [Fomitopsis schrenkii]
MLMAVVPANADASTEESNDSDKQSGDDSSELSESDDDDLSCLLNNGPKALENVLANERAIWTDETTETPSNDVDQGGSHLPSKIVRKTAQAKAGTRRQSDWAQRSAEQPVWTDDAQVQPGEWADKWAGERGLAREQTSGQADIVL